MTVLTRAPMAPYEEDDSSMMLLPGDQYGDEQPRLRKFSEGYREVDSPDDLAPVISTHQRPTTYKHSLSFRTVEDEGIFLEDEEVGDGEQQRNDSSSVSKSLLVPTTTTTTLCTKISDIAERELEKEEEESLDSLPVAMATVETSGSPSSLSSSSCVTTTSTANIPTATLVIRLTNVHGMVQHRDASLISVKIYKPTIQTKLGIRLGLNNDGYLQLTHISGLMKDSPLRPGDVLLRINGQNVSAWTTTKALQFLMNTWGWLNLTVRNPNSQDTSIVLASICKCAQGDKLGISFSSNENTTSTTTTPKSPQQQRQLAIHSLNVAGLLGGRSTIRAGDIVQTINSIPCIHLKSEAAVDIIRSLPNWVHILVRKPSSSSSTTTTTLPSTPPSESTTSSGEEHVYVTVASSSPTTAHDVQSEESLTFNDHKEENSNNNKLSDNHSDQNVTIAEVIHPMDLHDCDDIEEPAFVSITLTKTTQSEELGLSLVSVNNNIYIKRVGKLAEGHLREGMMLLAINHRPTCKMTLSETTRFIRKLVGSVTLLVRNPHGNPKYVRSVAFKEEVTTTTNKPNLIGVSFRGSIGRQLRICEIRENGLFIDSLLNVGDSVIQINDVPCSKLRPKDAVVLVRSSERIVSILVKSKSRTGAVIGRLGGRGLR